MTIEDARKQRLRDFKEWAATHITGDEKGEAHIFLDHLFRAFSQQGALDVGGKSEFRVRKAAEDGGGVAFADYVWKPVVLIEMKRRGADLSRHYRQAFDYWTRLVPGRPRYVVLCNFDEFWVYDFENQLDVPVDRLALDDLPQRYGPLAFLFPVNETPVFENDHVAVTRDAADSLATCFNKLISRRVERPLAQRFILQMLVALFAEDIGLLDQYFVSRLLDDCKSPADSYDILGGLFEAMNTPGCTAGGRYKGVDYFNGGLFREPGHLELHPDEVKQLSTAAKADWSKVRPEIFGVLFEHSLEKTERRAFGAHFTSPVDIMKIVGPTIVEPWREQIEGARSLKRLGELHQRMLNFTVLDPACGSGNFLYIAYRELKRLEARILDRMGEMSKRGQLEQMRLPFVTARNFHGMDINPFAVELAKVTLMIARKLSEDELHFGENPLPLDNLDANFIAADALINEHGNPVLWPKADVIIGNPPFGGAMWLKPQRGAEYANAVRRAYPEVPGMADYCVYWFRKAHDHLAPCTAKDPVAGRAGLVGTQNVRNNQSRVGGLDHVVQMGTIIEAVDNQPWSGEANVHVSIVNWAKTQNAKLLPAKRLLWFKVLPVAGAKKPRRKGTGPAMKEYELDKRECVFINSSLSDKADTSGAAVLSCNTKPQRIFRGLEPGNMGFVLTAQEAHRILKADARSSQVVGPYLTGRELLSGDGAPERWLIDFQRMDVVEAASFARAFEHVKRTVLREMGEIGSQARASEPAGSDLLRERMANRHLVARLDRWWQLRRCVPETVHALRDIKRYIVCSRVTKRPIFVFLASRIRPGDAVSIFGFDDDYSFGILQSNAHWQWFVAKCSKLKSDFRYTPESVFDTFPWPQSPTVKEIAAVAETGREVRRVRGEALKRIKGGLRAVYRTLELPGKNPLKDAHAALDAAVLAAYGFPPKKDLLAQLLGLNLEVAQRIENKEPVTAPGVPAHYPNAAALVSDDCIRPREK